MIDNGVSDALQAWISSLDAGQNCCRDWALVCRRDFNMTRRRLDSVDIFQIRYGPESDGLCLALLTWPAGLAVVWLSGRSFKRPGTTAYTLYYEWNGFFPPWVRRWMVVWLALWLWLWSGSDDGEYRRWSH